ncbi:hypothetical protein SmJEL517_g05602 [Synchytrium microbalum]|uniref:non-specific serine/threonine protein kinase n=1 Tax=Synchytrium microbalum TaxID=1806994 RepID=A0A507BKE7_9FUNG|nr:uncharacterized protein SmJEL517_g05602 [Synchytrium microbalum]TPX30960.1 hypothetical protein SmJEL517_g05602 [Synchytrium microbalum]
MPNPPMHNRNTSAATFICDPIHDIDDLLASVNIHPTPQSPSSAIISPSASPTQLSSGLKSLRVAGRVRGDLTAEVEHWSKQSGGGDSLLIPPPPPLSLHPDAGVALAAEQPTVARDVVVSEETLRKCRNTEIYFLDYYFDLFTYLHQRKQRTRDFRDQLAQRHLSEEQCQAELNSFQTRETSTLRQRRTRTKVSHFNVIAQVGQGGYGQVFLARKKETGDICALKKMSKKLLQKMGEVEHIKTEREILTQTDTPWLVKLLYAFQDINFVYLAMEFVPGGDLRTLLNNSGVLKEDFARFYVAEMFVAVAELHRLGFIHRDLKPENFLIDAGGHIKLTDFGLSRGTLSPERMQSLRTKLQRVKDTNLVYRSVKERRDIFKSVRREDMRAFSLVGSPDYMAPEVLSTNNSRGYTMSVDYWSIGCILFECLAGYPPFTAPTTDDVWVNVFHWKKVLERPVYAGVDEEFNLSNEAWDLITHLVAAPEDRYSSLGLVQSHPFFNSPNPKFGKQVDFSLLRTDNGMAPPFVPQLASETDVGYFDNFDSETDMALYREVRERAAELEREAGVDASERVRPKIQISKPRATQDDRTDSRVMRHDAYAGASSDLGRRATNQDEHLEAEDVYDGEKAHIFGVFDGHGEQRRWQMLQALFIAARDITPTTALLSNMTLDAYMSGTTASVVVETTTRVVVAGVGDSRVVIGKRGREVGTWVGEQVTVDHTCQSSEELSRVLKCGARVEKLRIGDEEAGPLRLFKNSLPYPGLVITRSLGDSVATKIGVLCEPDVTVRDIDPNNDVFIILASDGVWDALSIQQSVDIVGPFLENGSAQEASIALTQASLTALDEDQLDDNITNIIVFL